jgi:hypothetical protein
MKELLVKTEMMTLIVNKKYGITLSSPTVGGNMYLNFFITTLCEAIGMLIAIPMLNRQV